MYCVLFVFVLCTVFYRDVRDISNEFDCHPAVICLLSEYRRNWYRRTRNTSSTLVLEYPYLTGNIKNHMNTPQNTEYVRVYIVIIHRRNVSIQLRPELPTIFTDKMSQLSYTGNIPQYWQILTLVSPLNIHKTNVWIQLGHRGVLRACDSWWEPTLPLPSRGSWGGQISKGPRTWPRCLRDAKDKCHLLRDPRLQSKSCRRPGLRQEPRLIEKV